MIRDIYGSHFCIGSFTKDRFGPFQVSSANHMLRPVWLALGDDLREGHNFWLAQGKRITQGSATPNEELAERHTQDDKQIWEKTNMLKTRSTQPSFVARTLLFENATLLEEYHGRRTCYVNNCCGNHSCTSSCTCND